MKFKLQRYPSNENPRPILEPRKEIDWEGGAVFNPSVIYDGGLFKMLYRTYPSNLELVSPRLKRPGFYFKNQNSYIGYAESKDGINFERRDSPFISPDTEYDGFGCEDSRITKIEDTFYITYTAIDSPIHSWDKKDPNIKTANVRIALATTKDFIEVKKHGVIGPPKASKASAFFSEQVNGGKIGLLMTIDADSVNSHIAIRYYDSIEDVLNQTDESWATFLETSQKTAVLKTQSWLHRGPELGATPIKTEKGWLVIFSNESMSDSWTIGAALLDLNEPNKIVSRTSGYLLQPVTSYEREGLVPNVTFPEGAVIVGDELYVYYGCADTVIGLATCKIEELLNYLLTNKL
ncbi:MAG: glycosidase-like protein [Parcubacteria group bacterium Gr01-1014_46]|nr:MAG: glycosidase-like protein [Parcubacteria group bacterium Gr01-1014_46]